MPRVLSFVALALLCAAAVIGCGKKDDPEGGGGGSDGQPVLLSRTADDKREAGKRLQQIGVALHNYHDATMTFPAGVVREKGQLGLSWRVALLPYLEEGKLFNEFKLNEPWDSEHNKRLVARMPKCYESPGVVLSQGKTYLRSFAGPMAFIPGPWPLPKGAKGPPPSPWASQTPGSLARGRRMTEISDGTSNTLMVVEAAEPVEWTRPGDLPFEDLPGLGTAAPKSPLPKLGGPSAGGFFALFCDGAVRFIPDTLDETTLRGLITTSGGEVVSLDPPRDSGKVSDPREEDAKPASAVKTETKKAYGPPK